MPTQEKLEKHAAEYMANEAVYIFGSFRDTQITGIIAIEMTRDKTAEIRGIAVDSTYRRHGIGERLIRYACEALNPVTLTAETDDDAVIFYQKCGFETEKFLRHVEHGKSIRYKCRITVWAFFPTVRFAGQASTANAPIPPYGR